ncbi:dTMP kinase [Halobacteria archaeon HArc-gm2]|nr:dTMP kinase [Halobacteria archaeon HArc-gm2]
MLITLEGLDGSGKTSAWESLRDGDGTRDDAVPDDAVFTREPTETWYGEAVERSIGDDDADPLAELFLYTADHAAHLADTVRPALADGRVVVSDRYSDSRYAYQGATLSDALDDPLTYVQDVHAPWTRPPDATVYLDVDPETAAERSGATNKFETADYLADVRANYERLVEAEPDRFVRVDASQPQAEVLDEVHETVASLLP